MYSVTKENILQYYLEIRRILNKLNFDAPFLMPFGGHISNQLIWLKRRLYRVTELKLLPNYPGNRQAGSEKKNFKVTALFTLSDAAATKVH